MLLYLYLFYFILFYFIFFSKYTTAEDDDINKYYNPTTCYDNLTKLNAEESSRSGKRLKKKSSSSYERTVNLSVDQSSTDLNVVQTPFNFTETLSATTTITMAVPDAFIGIILGSGGQAISEITRFTGAKIIVSKRLFTFIFIFIFIFSL